MKKRPNESKTAHCPNRQTMEMIERAVMVLEEGGIVAFPTETYYGLAVDPSNEMALSKLFLLKKRERFKPILLLISQLEQLNQLTDTLPRQYCPLIERFWPGPLTLIFDARPEISSMITGGSGTVGVRQTPHNLACQLINTYGKPVTATSANLAGHPPAQRAEDVRKIFGEKVDYIVDGGLTVGGLCSTVVGLTAEQLVVKRYGQVNVSAFL